MLFESNADTVAYRPAYPPLVMHGDADARVVVALVLGVVAAVMVVLLGDEAADDNVELVPLPHPVRVSAASTAALADRFFIDPPVLVTEFVGDSSSFGGEVEGLPARGAAVSAVPALPALVAI